MHTGETIQSGTPTHTTSHCFIISEGSTAAGIDSAGSDIVHRSLTRCRNDIWKSLRQCSKENINNALRSLDIPLSYPCWGTCIHYASFRSDDFHGGKCAMIHWCLIGNQTAHNVIGRRLRHCCHSIDIASHLCTTATEIGCDLTSLHIDLYRKSNWFVFHPIIIEI